MPPGRSNALREYNHSDCGPRVTIDSVDGDHVSFSMTGTFRIYDENGGGPLKAASSSGIAILRRES